MRTTEFGRFPLRQISLAFDGAKIQLHGHNACVTSAETEDAIMGKKIVKNTRDPPEGETKHR